MTRHHHTSRTTAASFLGVVLLLTSCGRKEPAQTLSPPEGIDLPAVNGGLLATRTALYGHYSPMMAKRPGPGQEVVVFKDGTMREEGVEASSGPEALRDRFILLRKKHGNMIPVFVWADASASGSHLRTVLDSAKSAGLYSFRIAVAQESQEETRPYFLYFDAYRPEELLSSEDDSRWRRQEGVPGYDPFLRIEPEGISFRDKSVAQSSLEEQVASLQGEPASLVHDVSIMSTAPQKRVLFSFGDSVTCARICEVLAMLHRHDVACWYLVGEEESQQVSIDMIPKVHDQCCGSKAAGAAVCAWSKGAMIAATLLPPGGSLYPSGGGGV